MIPSTLSKLTVPARHTVMTITPTTMTPTNVTPTNVAVAIAAAPERVWHALTDGEVTPAYYYGFSVASDWQQGSSYRYTADGHDMITGEITAIEPGRTVTMTFRGAWTPTVAELPESTVTIALGEPAMPMPGVTVVTLTHAGLPDVPAADDIAHGWVLILSGLKTLLETGSPLAGGR